MSVYEIIAKKQGQKDGRVIPRDITPLIQNVKKVLEAHKISTGNYARLLRESRG